MAFCKLGMNCYNDKPLPVYLLNGNAVRDGEDAPVQGKSHAKVSVAALRHENGDTTFVTVNGWRDRAADVLAVRKGESILVIGPLKEREYNGKKYYDLDADFICRSGVDGYNVTGAYPQDYASPPSAAFADLSDEDEGDLPF